MLSPENIANKLDQFFSRNDYASAEKYILTCYDDADNAGKLFLKNELAGLYRKLGRKEDALGVVFDALHLIKIMGIEDNIGAATTYLNCGTVYKAFDKPEDAIPLFEKARNIYEKELMPNDKRFGGLYNNMALALVDLKRFDEAFELYDKAISVMEKAENGLLEVAITHLNIASAKEAELGLEKGEEFINFRLAKAMDILNNHEPKDGYYAFVCEKCASVFGYYGYFLYEKELTERARRIYERS